MNGKSPPGNSDFYNRNVFPSTSESLSIGSSDWPSGAISWGLEIIKPIGPISVLEAGCGAGRNLLELKKIHPNAEIFGFDGSPIALSMASKAINSATFKEGDLYGEWPFDKTFDVIFDITSGIPESKSKAGLSKYVDSLYKFMKPGGYAIVEAISVNDEAFKGNAVNIARWKYKGETKTERLITLNEAKMLYSQKGFEIIEVRLEVFRGRRFRGSVYVRREFIQLVLRKPK